MDLVKLYSINLILLFNFIIELTSIDINSGVKSGRGRKGSECNKRIDRTFRMFGIVVVGSNCLTLSYCDECKLRVQTYIHIYRPARATL